MAKPIYHAIARIVYGSTDREPMINVLYYRIDVEPPDPAQAAQAYADFLDNAVATPLKNVLTSSCQYFGVGVNISVNGVSFETSANLNAGAGTVVQDELPSFCAAVIQKRTAQPGRSGRGRWYVGGVPETFYNESRLTAPATAAYNVLAGVFAATLEPGSPNPAVACHYSPSLNFFYPITTTAVTLQAGTQRRRKFRTFI